MMWEEYSLGTSWVQRLCAVLCCATCLFRYVLMLRGVCRFECSLTLKDSFVRLRSMTLWFVRLSPQLELRDLIFTIHSWFLQFTMGSQCRLGFSELTFRRASISSCVGDTTVLETWQCFIITPVFNILLRMLNTLLFLRYSILYYYFGVQHFIIEVLYIETNKWGYCSRSRLRRPRASSKALT